MCRTKVTITLKACLQDGKGVEKSDDYLQGHALKRKNVTKKVTIALNACLQDGKGVEEKQRLP